MIRIGKKARTRVFTRDPLISAMPKEKTAAGVPATQEAGIPHAAVSLGAPTPEKFLLER